MSLTTVDGLVAKRLRRRSRKPKIEGSNPSQAFFFLFFVMAGGARQMTMFPCIAIFSIGHVTVADYAIVESTSTVRAT